MGGVSDSHERDLVSFSGGVRLADRNGVRLLRHVRLAAESHQLTVVEDDDRIVVADRGDKQPLGRVRIGRHHAFQSRKVGEDGVERLRVLGRRVGAGSRPGHDRERHLDLAAEHVVYLRRVVGDLVRAHAVEPHVHQVHDRAKSGSRSAHPRADEPRLRYGRIADALRAEPADQPLGQPHRAAPGVLFAGPSCPAGDVLPHHDD